MRFLPALLTVLVLTTAGCQSDEFSESTELDGGWMYRWGDSPTLPDGSWEWAQRTADGDWKAISHLYSPPDGRGERNIIWYRVQLPDREWPTPTVYFPNAHLAFQVFLDGGIVYEHGRFEPRSNAESHASTHLVSLGPGHAGKTLVVRLYSDEREIGFQTQGRPVTIGSGSGITRMIVRRSVENVLLGLAAMFIGAISLFLYMRRVNSRSLYVFSLGMFSLFIGFFFVSFAPVYDFLFPGKARMLAQFCAYLIFPVWLYLFVAQMIKSRLVTALWVAHSIWAILALIMFASGRRSLPGSIPVDLLFAITIPTMAVMAFRAAHSGHREARVFSLGLVVLGITGLNDILTGMGVLPYVHWFSPWGTLVFILVLVYLADHRFVHRSELLKVYSKELEHKSAELEEYARTLEDRVQRRTHEIAEKNHELGGALAELRDTQQQLVMREKMASLGNLVAGVAHEVNNPIGAISSAADACKRCVVILSEFLKREESAPAEARVGKALGILDEHTELIGTASQRVSEIVRSLRNFSRLDEAEFQDADVHEGIDSTLTLVHHQLKRRIEVIKNYGELPRINCYPNQLNQVFMNLLVNSAQAIEGEGTITITTSLEEDIVRIAVTDSGKGIKPEHIDQLFDPGFTTKGVGVGTGLGLSISYNIIEKHGGKIEVESELGQGTTFTISLPVDAAEAGQEKT